MKNLMEPASVAPSLPSASTDNSAWSEGGSNSNGSELSRNYGEVAGDSEVSQFIGISGHLRKAAARTERRWTPPTPAELQPEFSDYEIEDSLDSGGMGAVYRARQKSLGRRVALKLLPPELGADPILSERFEREARTMAMLEHPHIVRVYDFGRTASELCFIVMELIDGQSLGKRIADGKSEPSGVLEILIQVLEGLECAHERRVVHRDIKPANILVDSRGVAKLADFGLSLPMEEDSRLTRSYQFSPGTPDYMAPEQREPGKPVDERSDLYSLGVVLYQALTRTFPVGSWQPPSAATNCDRRFDAIVARALNPEPGLRYQSAAEFRAALLELRRPASRRLRLMSCVVGGAAVAVALAFWWGGIEWPSAPGITAQPGTPSRDQSSSSPPARPEPAPAIETPVKPLATDAPSPVSPVAEPEPSEIASALPPVPPAPRTILASAEWEKLSAGRRWPRVGETFHYVLNLGPVGPGVIEAIKNAWQPPHVDIVSWQSLEADKNGQRLRSTATAQAQGEAILPSLNLSVPGWPEEPAGLIVSVPPLPLTITPKPTVTTEIKVEPAKLVVGQSGHLLLKFTQTPADPNDVLPIRPELKIDGLPLNSVEPLQEPKMSSISGVLQREVIWSWDFEPRKSGSHNIPQGVVIWGDEQVPYLDFEFKIEKSSAGKRTVKQDNSGTRRSTRSPPPAKQTGAAKTESSSSPGAGTPLNPHNNPD